MPGLLTRTIKNIRFHYQYRCIVNQWVVGFTRGELADVIKTRRFNPDIHWTVLNSPGHQQADPFILAANNGTIELLIEDFRVNDNYAKIAKATFDKNFRPLSHKVILDTGSHLSYPHIYRENGKIYVLPESGKSGKLSLYEMKEGVEKLQFIKTIIDLPLLDANIIKRENRYWIFGVLRSAPPADSFELMAYFSDKLEGPYTVHPANPLQKGLDAVRGAGNFFEVDGELYRPTQNCGEEYGKSITIVKFNQLDTVSCKMEKYMTVSLDKKNRSNRDIHTIHTINGENGVIVVDGIRKRFSPIVRMKEIRNEKLN